MDKAISEYQKWKEQGEQLRAQAKQAMEARFRDLLVEAAGIAQEYQADFGHALKPPAAITAFRYRSAAKSAAKSKPKPAAAPAIDPKIVELRKRLVQAQKKFEVVKAAGKPTQNLEDKIYEIEDALRLAGQAG
jgi:formate-dependent nitrite reductase cytochrome c552 subunit